MPKRSEPAADLDDAALDAIDGGVSLLLPAVQSVPESLFSTGNTTTAPDGDAQTVKRKPLTAHALQPHKR